MIDPQHPDYVDRELALHELGHALAYALDQDVSEVLIIRKPAPPGDHSCTCVTTAIVAGEPSPMTPVIIIAGAAATCLLDDRIPMPQAELLKLGRRIIDLAAAIGVAEFDRDMLDKMDLTDAELDQAARFALLAVIAYRARLEALAPKVMARLNGGANDYRLAASELAGGDLDLLLQLSQFPQLFDDEMSVRNMIDAARQVQPKAPQTSAPRAEPIPELSP
ncbi:hypothetical protein LCM28_09890 [Salipiger pacificus]|nr:hypothetical protein [Alloyangia pacifica]